MTGRLWPWLLIGGIMARQPTMPEADYQRLVDLLGREGYATTNIQKVPQRSEPAASPRGEWMAGATLEGERAQDGHRIVGRPSLMLRNHA